MALALAPLPVAARCYSEPALALDTREIDEICRFRARAWTQSDGLADNSFPQGQWRDRFDSAALHWVIRDVDGQLVAAARLTLHERLQDLDEWEEYSRYGLGARGPIAAPARVVVCPTARGFGLAARLLDVQDDAARTARATCAMRQASPGMVRLLQARGWTIVGPASPDPRFPGVQFQEAYFPYAADWRQAPSTQSND